MGNNATLLGRALSKPYPDNLRRLTTLSSSIPPQLYRLLHYSLLLTHLSFSSKLGSSDRRPQERQEIAKGRRVLSFATSRALTDAENQLRNYLVNIPYLLSCRLPLPVSTPPPPPPSIPRRTFALGPIGPRPISPP